MSRHDIKSEDVVPYGAGIPDQDDATIAAAVDILTKRLQKPGQAMRDPRAVRTMLRLRFAGMEREEFVGLFLDNQHRLITAETLATGTIDGSSVYPREVLKAALRHNAAAVIFAHNHPSGIAEPRAADRQLTERLKAALALVDVRVLDHFVVGDGDPVSFAERGWL